MILIDTHAHLTMPEFDDMQNIIDRAKEASVSGIINVGFDLTSSLKAYELSKTYDFMYASAGIHPHHALDATPDLIEQIKVLASNSKVVAIGETGLDYFQNDCPKESQKEAFISHIDLADELNLPLIIHGRDSYDDIITILKEKLNSSARGVFHCFGGDIECAKTIMDLGFFISFTGIVTFKNAHNIREIVKYVPLDKILIETDCPYLAPQKYRGKRNEPSYLYLIAEKIAELKQIDIEVAALITSNNAKKLFGLNIIDNK